MLLWSHHVVPTAVCLFCDSAYQQMFSVAIGYDWMSLKQVERISTRDFFTEAIA